MTYDWVKKYQSLIKAGISEPKLNSSKPGRLYSISDTVGDSLKNLVIEREHKNKSIKENEFNFPIIKAIQDTQEERGKAPTVHSVSKITVERTLDRFGLKSVAGRSITTVRIEAVDDPRNAIVQSVVLDSLCRDRLPCLIGNFDSTQFMGVSDDSKAKLFVQKKKKMIEMK